MKVNIKNCDYPNESKGFKLNRIAKHGILLASTLAIISSNTLDNCINNIEDLNSMIMEEDFNISIDEINGMNIVLNDSDCSDTFFDEVCNKLNDDGICFKRSKNNEALENDNSIIITLDQQYSAGSDTLIFAPFDNARLGYSDSLALSMQAAFKQNGFLGNSIFCGKVGYRLDDNGDVCTSIPTETEETLSSDSDTSFVTISFGTQNINAELVAKSIENALARQKDYLKNYDTGLDLIYRACSSDSVEMIANYFNTDSNLLNKYNNIGNQGILDSQTIINPDVENMGVFNQNSKYSINPTRTKFY